MNKEAVLLQNPDGRRSMEALSAIETKGHKFSFGIAADEKERAEVRSLRFRVYKKHGYFKDKDISYEDNPNYDYDDYDADAVYFVGRTEDGKIIGSARLVKGKEERPLPIEKAFKFERPEEIKDIPVTQCAEIGKLVSEGTEGVVLGKLLTTMGLIDAILKYSERENLTCGFSFIKSTLLGRLEAADFPFYEIKGAEPIYPRDGTMAGYFYKEDATTPKGDIIPVYYIRDEIGPVITKAVEMLNQKKAPENS